ncbi:olfactory receptor 10Q1-like [Engystomops pustulosus]|uniref:olfactory receptor 10Q1-like n=1 Tax=Engystomops pustulosus TaxID=76066 RepID=UPI003AFB7B1F
MDRRNQTSPTEFIFQAFSNSTKFPALLFTLFFFLYLLILMWNFSLMLVIKTDSRLHTPMYFFLFNLSCMDICNTTTVVPQTLYNLISGRPTITFFGCASQMFFIIVFGGAQIVMITNMAYDRFVAITNPLRYKSIMTLKALAVLSATPWVVSTVMGLVMVYFVFQVPFCGGYEINHFFCDAGQVLWITCPKVPIHRVVEVLTFFIILFFFAFNFFFVVVSYILIIRAITKITTKQGQWKAFSTCSSHLNVVVVEYACLGFLYLRPTSAYAIDKDRIFVVAFTFGTPILNPLVYSVRNKAVRCGFQKLL